MPPVLKWILIGLAGLVGLFLVLILLGNPFVAIPAFLVGVGFLIERLNRKYTKGS